MSKGSLQFSFRPARSILLASAILSAASALAAEPASKLLEEARQLITGGHAAEAHRLLASHELEMAGQPQYDYLFGVAALDSGHAPDAISAFERVLAAEPAAASARLELGRALYESGDRTAARQQFDWLLSHNPPQSVRETAAAYLQSMDESRQAGGGWTRVFEFSSGYDSNANASTNDKTFLGVTLDPHSVETGSAFLDAAFSLGNVRAVGESSRAVTVGRIGHRWNVDAGFVDQTVATLDTTFDFGEGPTIFSLGLGGQYGLLDGESHHWGASGDFGVTHRFEKGWLARGLLRMGLLRYDNHFDSLSVYDATRYLAAFSLQHSGDRGGFGFTAFAGKDDPRESASAFGNDRLGLQFNASSYDGGGNGVWFQAAYQDVKYDNQPGFFLGSDRSDNVMSVAISGVLRGWLGPKLNLMPRISWVVNDSNIPLYEYERFELGLTLQRSF